MTALVTGEQHLVVSTRDGLVVLAVTVDGSPAVEVALALDGAAVLARLLARASGIADGLAVPPPATPEAWPPPAPPGAAPWDREEALRLSATTTAEALAGRYGITVDRLKRRLDYLRGRNPVCPGYTPPEASRPAVRTVASLPRRSGKTAAAEAAHPWDATEALRLLKTMSDGELSRWYGLNATTIQRRLLDAEVYGWGVPRPVTRRPCLRCHKPFGSEGKHHRICGGCKSQDDWKAGDMEGTSLPSRVAS